MIALGWKIFRLLPSYHLKVGKHCVTGVGVSEIELGKRRYISLIFQVPTIYSSCPLPFCVPTYGYLTRNPPALRMMILHDRFGQI